MIRFALIMGWTVVAAAWGTPPRAYLEEGFGGNQFPPPGWTIERTGTASSGWEKIGEGEAAYARGYMEGPYGAGGTTTFVSGNVSLEKGTDLTVKFRRYNSGRGTVRFYFRIILRKGGSEVWKKDFHGCQSWEWLEEVVPTINETGSDYKFAWQIDSLMGPSSGGAVYLHLDDIVVAANNASVEATSLGRVRALYR
jgi:hypothetical protein